MQSSLPHLSEYDSGEHCFEIGQVLGGQGGGDTDIQQHQPDRIVYRLYCDYSRVSNIHHHKLILILKNRKKNDWNNGTVLVKYKN